MFCVELGKVNGIILYIHLIVKIIACARSDIGVFFI